MWQHANAYFNTVGITVKRVLTDNGTCYRARVCGEALGEDVAHKRTMLEELGRRPPLRI